MDVGFDTIGNATLICYDKGPVLVTDPWVTGTAYFGSWKLFTEIPDEQMHAIKNAEFVWVSHGHPDHLSIRSLNLLKDKKILLPNHVGGRISQELAAMGFNVTVLGDREWTELSPRIKVISIPDYNQDAILLVDLDGALIVNLNDASARGWGPFVKKLFREYKESFLLEQFGYGTTDMINFFDDAGERIEPRAALRFPVGQSIARVAEMFGATYAVPFSSMQRYQREDSIWANEYMTNLDDFSTGFESEKCELLPAYIRYDRGKKTVEQINPKETSNAAVDPKRFGDDWSEMLESEEKKDLRNYFQSIKHLGKVIDFINFRVGGEDNVIELRDSKFKTGLKFEVPRGSLTRAVEHETFDDLLIGNFMKTTLLGVWPESKLYPNFTPYVTKYADNGLAKTPEQLKIYFAEYRHRAPLDYLRHRMADNVANAVRTRFNSRSHIYQLAQSAWWKVNKRMKI